MKKTAYIAAAAATLCTSCAEDIELKLSQTDTYIVVDGHITDRPGDFNSVRLTLSAEYFSNNDSPALTGATVTVSDDTETFLFAETSDGLYTAPDGWQGKPGNTYTLHISTPNAELTATDRMPLAYAMDSITCTYEKFTERYKVSLYAPEDSLADNFYLFALAYADSLLADSYTDLSRVKDARFKPGYWKGVAVRRFNDDSLAEGRTVCTGDKLTLYGMSVSEDFYNYIRAMGDIISGSTPMFSSTPANAIGNIDGALGFFAAFSTASVDGVVE